MMNHESSDIIEKTKHYVKDLMHGDSSGHDWFHVERVYKMALHIANLEGGDPFLVAMAALLHDVDDYKLNQYNQNDNNLKKMRSWCLSLELPLIFVDQIELIIHQISFKGNATLEDKNIMSIETKIVQDADRLDAIGAIGIGRTFAYGGAKGRLMYDPLVEPVMHSSFEAYRKNNSPTINHFYEKLLLLNERMNTSTAKIIAKRRHQFMEKFLEEFLFEANIHNC